MNGNNDGTVPRPRAGEATRRRESPKLYSKATASEWLRSLLIVSEARADPLTYPIQPGAGYIGFHGEKYAEESKFLPPPLPPSQIPPPSPAKPAVPAPRRGYRSASFSPVEPAWRRRKRDETSETAKCTSLRHVRFNCVYRAADRLNREARATLSTRLRSLRRSAASSIPSRSLEFRSKSVSVLPSSFPLSSPPSPSSYSPFRFGCPSHLESLVPKRKAISERGSAA